MADFNKFNSFTTKMGGAVNFDSDVLGAILTNVPPSSTNKVKADIAEITPGSGYVAGGPDVIIVSWSDTDIPGIAELVCQNASVLASGGQIGPFSHAVLYDKTVVEGPLIGWYDYPIEILLLDTESVELIFDDGSDNGTLTVGP